MTAWQMRGLLFAFHGPRVRRLIYYRTRCNCIEHIAFGRRDSRNMNFSNWRSAYTGNTSRHFPMATLIAAELAAGCLQRTEISVFY